MVWGVSRILGLGCLLLMFCILTSSFHWSLFEVCSEYHLVRLYTTRYRKRSKQVNGDLAKEGSCRMRFGETLVMVKPLWYMSHNGKEQEIIEATTAQISYTTFDTSTMYKYMLCS